MSTPPEQQSPSTDDQPDDVQERAGRITSTALRVAIWALVMLGLLGYLALGSVSAVSYRYSAFMERTFREVEQLSVLDIWTEQVENLPSAEWVLEAGFTAGIVVSVAGVAYGAWLLLVASDNDASGVAARRTHHRRAR